MNSIRENKSRKKIIMIFSLISLIFAKQLYNMEVPTKEPRENVKEELISEEVFEYCKKALPVSLKSFVDDFAAWPKEAKNKIQTFGLNFSIQGIEDKYSGPYKNNIGLIVVPGLTSKEYVLLIV